MCFMYFMYFRGNFLIAMSPCRATVGRRTTRSLKKPTVRMILRCVRVLALIVVNYNPHVVLGRPIDVPLVRKVHTMRMFEDHGVVVKVVTGAASCLVGPREV
jgi:hypothetical protein